MDEDHTCSWTPNVCKMMAFEVVFRVFGPLFSILLGAQVQLFAD